MKSFIETHLALVMVAAAVIGFFLPGAAAIPAHAISIALGGVIFLACLRIQWSEFNDLDWKGLSIFWIARFIALPIGMYGLATLFLPAYAHAFLLIGLVPAGVSSPAFTNLFGGNVPSALFVTLLSSAGSIVLIPAIFGAFGHAGVTPPADKLFLTLLECIFVPALLAYFMRHRSALVSFSASWGKFLTVILISLIVTIIVAGQRGAIEQNPGALALPLAVAFISYVIFIAAGLIAFRRSPDKRIAVLTCSVYNNSALAMNLALLEFPRAVVMTIVMAELCWTILPIATNPLIRHMKLRHEAHL